MHNYERKVIWAGQKLSGEIDKFDTTSTLPWRSNRTPYRIFLAEMLLVRTRADVVSQVYESIYEQYPNIYKLAQAEVDKLHELLFPLGLSKRVPYFIKAARYICEKFDGTIPDEIKTLMKIPGVGLYTATAIVTFAYGQPFVPSDVNVLRFLSRLTGLKMENKTKGSKELRNLTDSLSENHTGLKAEKLLDFTRLICRPRNPICNECPLTKHCIYFLGGK
jgi:A/G-specific adenine glycosylase